MTAVYEDNFGDFAARVGGGVLELLEKAGIPQAICDQIITLIADGERQREAVRATAESSYALEIEPSK